MHRGCSIRFLTTVVLSLLCLRHDAVNAAKDEAAAESKRMQLPEGIVQILRRMPVLPNPLEGHYDVLHPLLKRVAEIGELVQTAMLNKRYDGEMMDAHLVSRGLASLLNIFGNLTLSPPCRSAFMYVVPSVMEIFSGVVPVWIIMMLDAAGKYPMGSMRGSPLRKGSYHECIDIDLRREAELGKMNYDGIEKGFVGQFCTVVGEYGDVKSKRNATKPDYIRKDTHTREPYETQVCIPSVCSKRDAQEVVTVVARLFFDNFTTSEAKCHYPKERRISNWTAFVISVFSVVGLCLVLGTAYDIWLGFKQREKPVENWLAPNDASHAVTEVYQPNALGRVALCFSIPRNMGNLIDRGDKTDPDEMNFIHGVKFFSLVWLICLNLLLDTNNRRWENYAGFLEDLHTFSMHALINGRFLAETSFCVSGFLVAYLMTKELANQQGKYNTFYHYFHRYWRLMPPYMLVMLATSAFYYHSTDGPDWMENNEFEESCKRHGWKGLLFINNFFQDSDSCPPLHWYLATDLQLHLTAPLLIYPIYRKPKLGFTLLAVVSTCLMAVAPLVTGTEKLPYFVGRLFYLEPNHENYLDLVMNKPWTHAGPFMIGILFGCLVSRRSPNSKMNLLVVISGWFVAFGIAILIMMGFYPYIDGTSKMPVVLGIMYTTMAPTIWALAIGWMLYSCATGHGGLITYVLSWELYSPFSRLMYAAFLVNGLVIRHFFESRPDSFYYDNWIKIMIFVGVFFLTMVTAVIVSTTLERPFIELEKVLFGYQRGVTGTSVIHLNSEDDDDEDEDEDVLNLEESQAAQRKMAEANYLVGGSAVFVSKSDEAINLLNSQKTPQRAGTPHPALNGKG